MLLHRDSKIVVQVLSDTIRKKYKKMAFSWIIDKLFLPFDDWNNEESIGNKYKMYWYGKESGIFFVFLNKTESVTRSINWILAVHFYMYIYLDSVK